MTSAIAPLDNTSPPVVADAWKFYSYSQLWPASLTSDENVIGPQRRQIIDYFAGQAWSTILGLDERVTIQQRRPLVEYLVEQLWPTTSTDDKLTEQQRGQLIEYLREKLRATSLGLDENGERRQRQLLDHFVEQLRQTILKLRENVIEQRRTQLVDYFVEQVKQGNLGFPYQQHFRATSSQLVANIQAAQVIHVTVQDEIEKDVGGYGRTIFVVTGPYQLRSYYSKWKIFGGTSPRYLNPHTGRDEPTIILSPAGSYPNMDVVSDLFQEPVRITGKRFDNSMTIAGQVHEQVSVAECWNSTDCLREHILLPALKHLRPDGELNACYLREIIYQMIPETRAFNTTWCRGLLEETLGQSLAGKSWLDISAGWGDRLITAAALKMRYVAADPNTKLQPGYQQIIALHGDPQLQRVEPVGFENLSLGTELFDVVLTSPPYFNLEIYDQTSTSQSIAQYNNRTDWLTHFLFPVLQKAWRHLRVGGYLILHLGDNREIPLSEETNLFIETYLQGASWQGIIGVKNKEVVGSTGALLGGHARPVWVWQKREVNSAVRSWEPAPEDIDIHNGPLTFHQRSLYRCYPTTYLNYLDSLVGQYAPAYSAIKQPLIKQVISQLGQLGIDQETINQRIDELLMWLLVQSNLTERQLDINATVTLVQQLLSRSKEDMMITVRRDFPDYSRWQSSITYLRQKIQAALVDVAVETIRAMIPNDLWLASLLEAQEENNTIKWCVAMIRLNNKDY